MRRWLVITINVVAFDVLWTTAMFGAGKPWWWVAPAMVVLSMTVQLRLATFPWREANLILAGAAVGTSLDWLGSSCGMFQYASESTAEFLILFGALWVNFGTTLRPSFRWMWRRPLLAAAFGAIGGPCAYWVGSQIGAITLGDPQWRGLLWLAAQYGIVLPVWMLVASRTLGTRGGTGLQQTSHGAMR